MNLQTVFRDFNPAKFIVWVCLAVFIFLFSLRLDDKIDWSYWIVFTPIWIWKSLVIIGALVGDIVWWHNPHYRLEGQSYTQFRALLISLGLHTFLLIFEILAAHNLEAGDDENQGLPWISVFTPLILMSMISVGACVWAVKHDRSFELELFCSMNLLQFIFIALRLDGHFTWAWEVVFVPAWILLCVSVFAVFYSIIYAALLMIMPDINPNRKKTSMNSAIMYTCLVSPLLIFLVSLANKLNGTSPASSYVSIFLPLNISFLTLIMMSFATKRANQWWFGLRKDLCQFVLGVCPLLQEYANISYSLPQPQGHIQRGLRNQDTIDSEAKEVIVKLPRIDNRVVVPSISIEVPD